MIYRPEAFDSRCCSSYACSNEAEKDDELCSYCRAERQLRIRRERARVELPPHLRARRRSEQELAA